MAFSCDASWTSSEVVRCRKRENTEAVAGIVEQCIRSALERRTTDDIFLSLASALT